MSGERRILLTGATGKVGGAFIARFLEAPRFAGWSLRALCHQRRLPERPRLEVLTGSMELRQDLDRAVDGVTHVLHLATSKESPDTIMDVAVRGLFWLLEACRTRPDFQRFILIGGDASVGHAFYPHPTPVTETQRHSAYPGCYALSKVLEEVMLEQYALQYSLDVCCLRAPWIMEKDDLRFHLSFGADVFGAPRWRELVPASDADAYARSQAIPILLDGDGTPVKRNFVHVDDLVSAILAALDHPRATRQTFNVSMDEPIDYGALGAYLNESRHLPTVGVRAPFHSTWLDNSKARFLLGWRPAYDLKRLADAAWDYRRGPDDPRVVWYPG
jgi:UDP-glucose 4-epimerase